MKFSRRTLAHRYIFFKLFRHFGAKTRTVGFLPKIGRTFRQKLVEFCLEWPNFAQISQKSTSFRQKVRPNFGRDLTVQFLTEIRSKWRNNKKKITVYIYSKCHLGNCLSGNSFPGFCICGQMSSGLMFFEYMSRGQMSSGQMNLQENVLQY
jgi:hypothetical protein